MSLLCSLRFQTSFKFVVCSISSHFHMYPKFVMHWDSKQTLQPRFLFLLSLKVYVCEPPYVSEAETSSEAARSPQLLFLSNRMRAQLVEDHAATHPRKFLVSNWTNFYIWKCLESNNNKYGIIRQNPREAINFVEFETF